MKKHAFFKKCVIIAAVFGLLGILKLTHATGTSGGLLLVTANSARPMALGNAYGAMKDDPAVVFFNPAGLAEMKRLKGLFTHQQGIIEDYYENLNIVFPIRNVGTFGATIVYHGMTPLNDAGVGVPEVSAYDILGIITYARPIPELLDKLRVGINVKVLNSLIDEYSAIAFATDLGVLWSPEKATEVGLTIRNIGTPLKHDVEADPLPLRIVLSGKYTLLKGKLEDFFVAADIEQLLSNETYVHLGSEFVYAKVFAVRLGYIASSVADTSGLNFGVGIHVPLGESQLQINYAYQTVNWSGNNLSGNQLFTFGFVY